MYLYGKPLTGGIEMNMNKKFLKEGDVIKDYYGKYYRIINITRHNRLCVIVPEKDTNWNNKIKVHLSDLVEVYGMKKVRR